MVTGTDGSVILNRQLMSIAPFAPGLFTLNEAVPSQGLIVIAGAQALAPPSGGGSHPVAAADFISIYCTGLGAVSNRPAPGSAAQADPLSITTTRPTVTIGDVAAQVSFSGLAPGAVGRRPLSGECPSADGRAGG